jgi:hypothetical protein
VAFDWGEEIHLDQARSLLPAEEQAVLRRRRTPLSIGYRPAPLRFGLTPVQFDWPELGVQETTVEATVFDFAAASMALRTPFALGADSLLRLATALGDTQAIQQAARHAAQRLYDGILPAIQAPHWSELTEEYVVFEFSPETGLADIVLSEHPSWLAGLVRLDSACLHSDEVAEALRLHIRYGQQDLLVADWAAAVLIDVNCAETLQVVEFANLQLLEFREIDNRLDDRLADAARLVHRLAKQWLPFWRPFTVQVRALGDLKVEANTVFERTQNALKLVGDQYLARAYRLLSARFYLEQWQESIQRSLNVIESAYRVLADQAAAWRAEALELSIVLLIVIEIVLTLMGY